MRKPEHPGGSRDVERATGLRRGRARATVVSLRPGRVSGGWAGVACARGAPRNADAPCGRRRVRLPQRAGPSVPQENNASAPSPGVVSQARSVQGNHRRRRVRRVCAGFAWTIAQPPVSGSDGTATGARAVVRCTCTCRGSRPRSAACSALGVRRSGRRPRPVRRAGTSSGGSGASGCRYARRIPAWVRRARRSRPRGVSPRVRRGPVPVRKVGRGRLREVVGIWGEPAHREGVRAHGATSRDERAPFRRAAPARRSARSTACSATAPRPSSPWPA